MIINFPSRFTANGREVGGEVDSKHLSLAGMCRLLLGETIEQDSRQALRVLVLGRINSSLEKYCDEFYGTEKKDEKDFSESLNAIILLVKNNLHDVIEGLNGEQSKMQILAGLIPMKYNLHEAGVSKNSLFGTNLRILVASCFRNENLAGMVNDMSECLQIRSGKMPFAHMIKRFQYELARYAGDSVRSFEEDDMYQEGCIVLWNCVNKYAGQNFIPLRQYFLRSLRNKSIDMLRSTGTDKRKISLKTTSSCAESFNASQAHQEVAKRYIDSYHEWLNCVDNEDTSFVAPNSVGEYFPEAGKSITETQINKTSEELFDTIISQLFGYLETQISEKHFSIFKEFYSIGQIGVVFLRFLFGNPEGEIDGDGIVQDFLRTYMKECVFFDGEKYCFQNLGDLQETFLMMCQEILEKDPMIRLACRLGTREYHNDVPF